VKAIVEGGDEVVRSGGRGTLNSGSLVVKGLGYTGTTIVEKYLNFVGEGESLPERNRKRGEARPGWW